MIHWQSGHNTLCKHSNMLKNLEKLGAIVGYIDLDWSFQNFEQMKKNEEIKKPQDRVKNAIVKVMNGPGVSYISQNV